MIKQNNDIKKCIVLKKQAEKLFNESKYEEVVSLLSTTSRECKKELSVNLFLGYSYYKTENYGSAILAFEHALAIQPNAENALFLKAKCKEKLSDLRGAETDYRAALAINPNAPDVHRRLGFISEYHQNHGAAIWYYQRALKVDPEDLIAANWLTEAMNKLQANLAKLPPHLLKLISSTLVRTLPCSGTQSIIILRTSSGKKYQLKLNLSDWSLIDKGKEIASSDIPSNRQVLLATSDRTLDIGEYLGRKLLNIYLFLDCNEAHFEFEEELVLEIIDMTKINWQ